MNPIVALLRSLGGSCTWPTTSSSRWMLILGARAEADPGAPAPDQFEVANLLLAGLVMSEIVYYGSQLYLYRRGFHD